MAAIYFFVFVVIFDRSKVGEDPYIVFLLSALLPWVWFNGTISDCTRAFLREAKLIRSTTIPRTIWVNRIVLSKGIEFIFSLPVLAVFVIAFGAPVTVNIVFFPLAIVIQTILTCGVGLIVAPLVVFFRDLQRATKLILRLLFYASPIVYSAQDVPDGFSNITIFNPLSGLFGLYRSAFFPGELNWAAVGISAIMSLLFLALGLWVFSRTQRAVLKEI